MPMPPLEIQIAHDLGSLVMRLAMGLAVTAVLAAVFFVAGMLDGYFHARRVRRWTDPGRYRDAPGVWRSKSKEVDIWRGHDID